MTILNWIEAEKLIKEQGSDVTIPNGFTSIDRYAFSGGTKRLTSIVIPDSVTSIDDFAFIDTSLQSIVIPDSVASIGRSAFYGTPLKSIFIGKSVKSIGDNAFVGTKLTSVVIPNGVVSIGAGAFESTQLESIIIPNSVTSIGRAAFYMAKLTNIVIPDSVTSLGVSAFTYNPLKSVIIGKGVRSIGDFTFYGTGLTNIIIPNGVTSIGNEAFNGTELTNIIIPNSVTSIGDRAFYQTKLSSIIIPKSVTYIGEYAFGGAKVIREGVPEYTIIITNQFDRYEGETLVTFIETTQVASGTTLYYSLSGNGITAADFSAGSLTGSAIVGTDGKLSFSHIISRDNDMEIREYLQIKIFIDSALTIQVGEARVGINDRKATSPTYTITPSTTSINEGSTLTTSVATTDVASGTTLYYSLSGTGITAADFSAGALTGSGTVGTDGKISIRHTIANDLTTEGAETLDIKLFSDSTRSTQVGSTASVSISDTSITPAPTYTLTPSSATINEGAALTSTVATTNVTTGTKLYYALSGTGITTADFSAGALTGEGSTDAAGKFTFSHTIKNDLTTEGAETFSIKLYSDSARTLQVGSTATVSIVDLSTTPAPTYTLTPSSATINEGSTHSTSVATTNVASGTTLYYSLSGTGITSADFSAGALTGLGTVGTDGKLSISHTIANDLITEGSEIVEINLYSDSARTLQVGTTASVSIVDTSIKSKSFNLDVDGDGKITALGDGLMVIRKLFGAAFAGDALTNKAMSPTSTRTTAEIHQFIESGISAGTLDVDKDGKTTALGDGLMVIRHLFGAAFAGAALTNKAISPDSPYFGTPVNFAAVATNIDSMRPV